MQTKTKNLTRFFSCDVVPIGDIEEAKKRGHYTDCYSHITSKTVVLPKAEGTKRVYVVPFDRSIGETEYVELLAQEGLKPCVNAPNYLAGLMAQVPEDKMPEKLQGKYIVAAEPHNESSVFRGGSGDRCFLFVGRLGGADRELSLASVDDEGWGGVWAFLAEEA